MRADSRSRGRFVARKIEKRNASSIQPSWRGFRRRRSAISSPMYGSKRISAVQLPVSRIKRLAIPIRAPNKSVSVGKEALIPDSNFASNLPKLPST
jgi:hypothetical protein